MANIVVFGCESSGYPAVAAALESFHHPVGEGSPVGLSGDRAVAQIDLVRLPCSGRIEVDVLLGALERGASGVLVLGCPADSCKHVTGNLRAEKRVARARRALRDAGIEEDRVRIEFLSSLDAHRASELLAEMREQISALETAATGAGSGGKRGAQ